MPWTEKDWTLLTQLRPGTAFEEFIAPLGGKLKAVWEEESFEMVDDDGEEVFSGSIDDDGKVDGCTFNDDRVSFDGIAPGMSFLELTKKVSGLFRDCSDDARAMKYDEDFDAYWAPHSPGIAWHFIRTDDVVLTVSLVPSDDDVVRVDPFFEDLNFKLVVIESLVRDDLVTLPEGESIDDLDEDDDDYSDEYVERVIQRLDECYEMPLEQALLDKIEYIEIDGGSEIYHYIHPLFDGDSEEFDVMGIEGIEHLPNLTSLSIISMTNNLSLLPLANHPKLEEVSLSSGMFKDFLALESVPNLKKVSGFFDGEIYEEDDEVLKRLADKGVDVHSFD